MAVLQQLLLLASACVQMQHQPDADVSHQPHPDVVYSQGFLADTQSIEVPIEIDVLKNKRGGGRALLGETMLATALVQGQDVSLRIAGQPPVSLFAACPPPAASGRR